MNPSLPPEFRLQSNKLRGILRWDIRAYDSKRRTTSVAPTR